MVKEKQDVALTEEEVKKLLYIINETTNEAFNRQIGGEENSEPGNLINAFNLFKAEMQDKFDFFEGEEKSRLAIFKKENGSLNYEVESFKDFSSGLVERYNTFSESVLKSFIFFRTKNDLTEIKKEFKGFEKHIRAETNYLYEMLSNDFYSFWDKIIDRSFPLSRNNTSYGSMGYKQDPTRGLGDGRSGIPRYSTGFNPSYLR